MTIKEAKELSWIIGCVCAVLAGVLYVGSLLFHWTVSQDIGLSVGAAGVYFLVGALLKIYEDFGWRPLIGLGVVTIATLFYGAGKLGWTNHVAASPAINILWGFVALGAIVIVFIVFILIPILQLCERRKS